MPSPRLQCLPSTVPATALHNGAFASRLMEMLAVPTFVLDTACRVMIWNKACERLTGVAAGDVLGTRDHWRSFHQTPRPTLADLLMQNRSAELSQLYPLPAIHPAEDGALCAESWCDMPRVGTRRYLAADASPIHDDGGAMVAVVQTLRDMTDEKMAQAALEQLATRDGLTGLANRRCFDDTLHAEWARALRQKQPLSLLMVDVDNFKAYNDANGHLGGDECLKRIARAVSSEMRANDLVARYGGEEFAVILPNQSLKGAAIVAERIRSRVERLTMPALEGGALACPQPHAGANSLSGASGAIVTSGASGHVTVSIGAATAIAAPDTSVQQLVAIADAALYRAKHMGRNRISLPIAELL